MPRPRALPVLREVEHSLLALLWIVRSRHENRHHRGGVYRSKLARPCSRGTLAAERIARSRSSIRRFADLPGTAPCTLAGDISDPGFAARAIAGDTTSIFHLGGGGLGRRRGGFHLGMR